MLRLFSCSVLSDSFTTLWTASVHEFSRLEYWSGLPFPSPGSLPDLGIEPRSLLSLALAGGFFTSSRLGSPYKVLSDVNKNSWNLGDQGTCDPAPRLTHRPMPAAEGG